MKNKTYEFEIEGTKISVTTREVIDLYPKQWTLKEKDIEQYAAKNVARRKYYKTCEQWLDKTLIRWLLKEERKMETGETVGFRLKLHFHWYVEIRKEDEKVYGPYKYAINAYCLDNMQIFTRRYLSLDRALLHCLNSFNENASIPNRYKSIDEYLAKSS